jgi:hypothetical protein
MLAASIAQSSSSGSSALPLRTRSSASLINERVTRRLDAFFSERA